MTIQIEPTEIAREADPLAGKATQTIELVNPVAEHFGAFIISNAFAWQSRAMMALEPFVSPEQFERMKEEFTAAGVGCYYGKSAEFHDLVEQYLGGEIMVSQDEAKGQHIVICGAGPSLNDHAEEYCPTADQVWGCNSAVTWLAKHGHKVTHGFTVDQTAHMVNEWEHAPDIEYLLASTVHPHLVDSLEQQERGYRFFHNFVGLKGPDYVGFDENGQRETMSYEDWLYSISYPNSVRCGAGLNAVTRAIELASFMGATKITVLGADCALKIKTRPPKGDMKSPAYRNWLVSETIMHADGGNALASEATPVVLCGTIDGGTEGDVIRRANGQPFAISQSEIWKDIPLHVLKRGHGRFWATKPDMMMSAQWLVRMQRAYPDVLQLVGDTLPNALRMKEEAYLRRLPNFVDAGGRLANIPQYNVPTVPQDAA